MSEQQNKEDKNRFVILQTSQNSLGRSRCAAKLFVRNFTSPSQKLPLNNQRPTEVAYDSVSPRAHILGYDFSRTGIEEFKSARYKRRRLITSILIILFQMSD